MAKRGKTPSLIGSNAGRPRLVTARGKRACKRCEAALPKGTRCFEIPKPGNLGHKTICKDCLSEMIKKSRKDLEELENQVLNVQDV